MSALEQVKSSAPLLRATGIGKRFGGPVAVNDLSFEIQRSEIVGMIGPNGAGKTTTFNLISGYLQPSAGRLMFDGEDITRMKPYRVSTRGLVRTFQHDSFFKEMTVFDNAFVATAKLRLGIKSRIDRALELLTMTGIHAHRDAVAGSLPHGIQRLLSIAIALASRPKLLCLDEPLTGLHATEVASILRLLDSLRIHEGLTILMIDHNMKAVMGLCDRLIVLNYGEMLAQGLPGEVRANAAVIAAYLGSSE